VSCLYEINIIMKSTGITGVVLCCITTAATVGSVLRSASGKLEATRWFNHFALFGDQHSSGELGAATAEAWSRREDVLWIWKTTSEAVSSGFLNSLCSLARNKRTRHLPHKEAEGQENAEKASVKKKWPGRKRRRRQPSLLPATVQLLWHRREIAAGTGHYCVTGWPHSFGR
jgi:hypothetical protein